MKNRPFPMRLRFALAGIRSAWRTETSFRTQAVLGGISLLLLLTLRPRPVWWALVLLASGLVLGLELMNTALESLVDHLHPEVHPVIGRVKDCAAGAVLLASIIALGVLAALLADYFG